MAVVSVLRPALAYSRRIFSELAGRGADPAGACCRSPGALYWIASELGLTDPPLALLILVFCIFLVVIYRLSVDISDLKDANIAMAQRVAILEFQLQSLNEKQ